MSDLLLPVAVFVIVLCGTACLMHAVAGLRYLFQFPRGAAVFFTRAVGYGVLCALANAYFQQGIQSP